MANRLTLKNNSDHEGSSPHGGISVPELLRLVVKSRRAIGLSMGIVMILIAVVVFLMPNQYRSRATILPSGKSDRLTFLKELTLPGGFSSLSEDNSSALFPEIIKSDQVKDGVLGGRYSFEDGGHPRSITLKEYFGEDNPERAREALERITDIRMDRKTGIIEIGVETRNAGLSQGVLKQMLAELEHFNLHRRRSQARDNEKYLARELALREKELRTAEDNLEQYQSVNRDWDQGYDPEIMKEITRLKREIEVRAKTYLFLQEQYEIAKLEVQKDVPIVSLLDPPSYPILKAGPHRMMMVLFSEILAFVMAFAVVFAIDTIRRRSRQEDNRDWEVLRNDVQTAFPLMRRLKSKRTVPEPEPEEIIRSHPE